MSRNLVIGIISVVVSALGLVAVLSAPGMQHDETIASDCDVYLDRPVAGWVSLSNCLLDMEALVLESEQGEFELLQNRRQGLSRALPNGSGPHWVAAWAPLRAEVGRVGVVRVVYRLDSVDLMKWLNTFDRADEREKERMWVDPLVLRRMAKHPRIDGRAEKPPTDVIQRALGNVASATMLTLVQGKPPKSSSVGPMVGVVLLSLLALTIARLSRKPRSMESSPAQMAQLGVNKVKLEYGALEELRREEEATKKKRRGPKPESDD